MDLGHNLNKLDNGPYDDAIYYISRLVVSDKKIFPRFANISLCKACDPQRGQKAQVYNLITLGRGLLNDAAYQISRF